MGRPRKGREKNRRIDMGCRFPNPFAPAAMRIAVEKGLSMSDVVCDLLIAHLKRQGIKDPRP
jgi:hypothetical protein